MFKKKKKDTVDEQQDSQSRKSGIKIGKVAGGVIAFFLAGYLLVGSIYSLKENEYAVITTFGVPGKCKIAIHSKAGQSAEDNQWFSYRL